MKVLLWGLSSFCVLVLVVTVIFVSRSVRSTVPLRWSQTSPMGATGFAYNPTDYEIFDPSFSASTSRVVNDHGFNKPKVQDIAVPVRTLSGPWMPKTWVPVRIDGIDCQKVDVWSVTGKDRSGTKRTLLVADVDAPGFKPEN